MSNVKKLKHFKRSVTRAKLEGSVSLMTVAPTEMTGVIKELQEQTIILRVRRRGSSHCDLWPLKLDKILGIYLANNINVTPKISDMLQKLVGKEVTVYLKPSELEYVSHYGAVTVGDRFTAAASEKGTLFVANSSSSIICEDTEKLVTKSSKKREKEKGLEE